MSTSKRFFEERSVGANEANAVDPGRYQVRGRGRGRGQVLPVRLQAPRHQGLHPGRVLEIDVQAETRNDGVDRNVAAKILFAPDGICRESLIRFARADIAAHSTNAGNGRWFVSPRTKQDDSGSLRQTHPLANV